MEIGYSQPKQHWAVIVPLTLHTKVRWDLHGRASSHFHSSLQEVPTIVRTASGPREQRKVKVKSTRCFCQPKVQATLRISQKKRETPHTNNNCGQGTPFTLRARQEKLGQNEILSWGGGVFSADLRINSGTKKAPQRATRWTGNPG